MKSAFPIFDWMAARIARGEDSCLSGLRDFDVIENFFDSSRANQIFEQLQTDVEWAGMRWNGWHLLPQRAFEYKTAQRKAQPNSVLEDLIRCVEEQHAVKVHQLFCNLLRDGNDHIEWHQDSYGAHLFVASFGQTRTVEYRAKQSKELITSHEAQAGSLYYVSPNYDRAHEHRVPKVAANIGPRISIAMFCYSVILPRDV